MIFHICYCCGYFKKLLNALFFFWGEVGNFWIFFHVIGILQRYKTRLSVAVCSIIHKPFFNPGLSGNLFWKKLENKNFLFLVIRHCYKLVSCQASLEAMKMSNYVAIYSAKHHRVPHCPRYRALFIVFVEIKIYSLIHT